MARTKEGHSNTRHALVSAGNRSQSLPLTDVPFVNNAVQLDDVGARRPQEDLPDHPDHPDHPAIESGFESNSSPVRSSHIFHSTLCTDHQATPGLLLGAELRDDKVSVIAPSSPSLKHPTPMVCTTNVFLHSAGSCLQGAAGNASDSEEMTAIAARPDDNTCTDPGRGCPSDQHGKLENTDKSLVSDKSANLTKPAADKALKSVGCQVDEVFSRKTFRADLVQKISTILSGDIGPESKLKLVLETLFEIRHTFPMQAHQHSFRLALESEELCINRLNELKKDDVSSGSISLTGDTPLRRSEQSFEESHDPTLLQTLHISANLQNLPMNFHFSANGVVRETKQDQGTAQQDLPGLCSPSLYKQACGKDQLDEENWDARSDSEKNVDNAVNPSCGSKPRSPQRDDHVISRIDSEVPVIENERMEKSGERDQESSSAHTSRAHDDQRHHAKGSVAMDGRNFSAELVLGADQKSDTKTAVDSKQTETADKEKKALVPDSGDDNNPFDVEGWDEDLLGEVTNRIENVNTASLDHAMENALYTTDVKGSEADLRRRDKAVFIPITSVSAELVSLNGIDDLLPGEEHAPLTSQVTGKSGNQCGTAFALSSMLDATAVMGHALSNGLLRSTVEPDDKIRTQTSLILRGEQGLAADRVESLQMTDDLEEVLDGEILGSEEHEVVQTSPRLVSNRSDLQCNSSDRLVQDGPNWRTSEGHADDDSAETEDEIMDYEILDGTRNDTVCESGRLASSSTNQPHDGSPNGIDFQDGSLVIQAQNDLGPEDDEEEIMDGEVMDDLGHPIVTSGFETASADSHLRDELRMHTDHQADAMAREPDGSGGKEDEEMDVEMLDGVESAGMALSIAENRQHDTLTASTSPVREARKSASISVIDTMANERKPDALANAFTVKSMPSPEPLRETHAIDFGDSDESSSGGVAQNGILGGKRPLSEVYSSRVPNPYLGELLSSQCGNEDEISEQPTSDVCLAGPLSVARPSGRSPPGRGTAVLRTTRDIPSSAGGSSSVAGPIRRPLPQYVPRHVPHCSPHQQPQAPSGAISSSTDELYQSPPRKHSRQPTPVKNQRSVDTSGSSRAMAVTGSEDSDVQFIAVMPGRNTTVDQSLSASPEQPARRRSVVRACGSPRQRPRNTRKKRENSGRNHGETEYTLIDTIDLTQDTVNEMIGDTDPGTVGESEDEDDVSDSICSKCHEVGNLMVCEGVCNRAWHHECIGFREVPEGEFKCSECSSGAHHCGVCDGTYRTVKCGHPDCGRFFHPSCLRVLPTVQNVGGSFFCPLHHCGLCLNVTDFRRDARCVVCTVSYHSDCIPPGCIEKHERHFVCSRHKAARRSSFSTDGTCCSCHESSGKVLNCSGCAGSWHLDCLPMRSLLYFDGLTEKNRSTWTCVACLRGDYPLVNDVVWAGLRAKTCLLWPAVVKHTESSDGKVSVETICENKVMTIDNRKILFWNYRDPRKELESKNKSNALRKAIEIGEVDYDNNVSTKNANSRYGVAELSDSAFKRISSLQDPGGLAKVTSRIPKICECHISKQFCSTDDCPNVAAGVECHRSCSSKKSCMNQKFQRKQYGTQIKVDYSCLFQDYVMKAKTFISKGTLILEVCGIVLSEAEAEGRLSEATSSTRVRPYPSLYMYLLRPSNLETQEPALYIDLATECNLARFFWHSCDPNCHTETLVADGSLRMGIYASYDINVNERLSTLCSFPDPDHRTCFKNAIVVGCMCDSRECAHSKNVLSRYQVQPNSFSDQGPR